MPETLQSKYKELEERHKTLKKYYQKYSIIIDDLKAKRAMTNKLLNELKDIIMSSSDSGLKIKEINKLLVSLMRIR